MKRTELIKKLLPGFIPLFVFIAADEIWGTRVGLIVALITGILELGYTYFKEKRFDKFIILDTALLLVLGGISLILNNDIFFKVKPAVIEAILCIILAFSAFTKFDIVGVMSMRYMKGIEITDEIHKNFKKTLKLMFWIFGAHTLLVVYSAFFMSKEAWAFISGGLFYIIFGIYFVYEFLHQKIKIRKKAVAQYEDEEWLPVVDEEGRITGKALRSVCHSDQKLIHPVVHLHVMNSHRHLFLQMRPETKIIQPGKWDTAVGGHISFGEDVKTALKREAWEEIGMQNFSAKPIGSYIFESEVEKEMVYSFLSYDYKQIRLHSEEVTEGKFWSKNQIEQNLGKGIFTPNFEFEYENQLKGKIF